MWNKYFHISSHKLTFFQKLVLCWGLKFSFLQRISGIEIQASSAKLYWKLERTLPNDKKELTAATLRSIALNYIECKSPKPPKTLQRAIKQLKRLDNIVVTKPDKGTGVVVRNKSDYFSLPSQASVNDTSKFTPVSLQKPKMRSGRPLKHYITPCCRRRSTSSRWFGEVLPNTYKEKLSMRPILSATGTYNYVLAKWLDKKMKPLSVICYTKSDTFSFAEEIQNLERRRREWHWYPMTSPLCSRTYHFKKP